MSLAPSGAACAYDVQAAADLLRALAHPTRLQILCRLLQGEVSVAGFESELGMKQPSLSQQLGQLREASLVTTRRVAKSVFYSLADDRLPPLLDALRVTFASAPRDEPPPPPGRPLRPIVTGFAPAGAVPSVRNRATPGRATPDRATPDLATPGLAVPGLAAPGLAVPGLAVSDRAGRETKSPVPARMAASSECGFFSIAGWSAATGGKGHANG
jgi:DNA-binding transcriptional ArsR family regulator